MTEEKKKSLIHYQMVLSPAETLIYYAAAGWRRKESTKFLCITNEGFMKASD